MSSGYLIALLAAAAHGLMSFLVHLQSERSSPAQMVFYRGLATILVLLPFCWRDLGRYAGKDWFHLWVRAAFGAASVLCYFFALAGTSSGNANLMFSATPVFVTLLAWAFFSERINAAEAGGVALVVLGNVLLYLPNKGQIEAHVWIFGLSGAAFAGFSLLALGAAAKKHSSSLIVFGFGLASMLGSALVPGTWAEVASARDWALIAAIAALGIFYQVGSTHSFRLLKSPIAAALGRTSILFSGALDIFAAAYRIHVLEIASYVFVLAGVFAVHHFRDKHQINVQ